MCTVWVLLSMYVCVQCGFSSNVCVCTMWELLTLKYKDVCSVMCEIHCVDCLQCVMCTVWILITICEDCADWILCVIGYSV